jgi:predicted HicB family RNase H-like nuclease
MSRKITQHRVYLDLPELLEKAFRRDAAKEGLSLNAWLCKMLSKGLGLQRHDEGQESGQS